MRIAVLGNSGSGKSTLASFLARSAAVEHLDLDSIAWEPGKVAVARPIAEALADVERFCLSRRAWVVEGCYASLVGAALKSQPRLLLLNPGRARCVANCRSRPWEPHKYASAAEQDARLEALLAWVVDYYERDGDMSLAAHRGCFDAYPGPKAELTAMPALEQPDPVVARWLCGTGATDG